MDFSDLRQHTGEKLTEMLINYLNDQPNVELIGPADTESSRAGTISFVHNTKSSKEIVLAANKQGIGIRYNLLSYSHQSRRSISRLLKIDVGLLYDYLQCELL
jgi:selenocysteine lyase/cysteine desulfurase